MSTAKPRPSVQAARAVLTIRPASFAPNPQTAESNRFQGRAAAGPALAAAARREHDALAAALERSGVAVHSFEGQAESALPDEAFPNNWISFHEDGTAVLYPMLAPNRREERRTDVLDGLRARGFAIDTIVDLTHFEREQKCLEGTGSLVLDRSARTAYACRSPRTHPDVLEAFAAELGYRVHVFDALDGGGHAVYHTNVVLSVGAEFALACSEAVPGAAERRTLLGRLAAGGRDVIEISPAQMHAFAGNALELEGSDGPVIALSSRAHAALDANQRRRLASHGRVVTASIDTIETFGGGSVRCMLAEIHVPLRR